MCARVEKQEKTQTLQVTSKQSNRECYLFWNSPLNFSRYQYEVFSLFVLLFLKTKNRTLGSFSISLLWNESSKVERRMEECYRENKQANIRKEREKQKRTSHFLHIKTNEIIISHWALDEWLSSEEKKNCCSRVGLVDLSGRLVGDCNGFLSDGFNFE